jgi:hypothetical protein
LQLVPGGYTRAPLSFRWSPWDPGGCTDACSAFEGCPRSESTIRKLSLFQTANNHISRDVKDLFLGYKFVWCWVIVKLPMLQLEDELLGKGRGNVRCHGTNGSGPYLEVK